ncbi:DUF6232 family protein [Streptomyces sp. NPDC058401]|uniref:DUF6232 family protein n=1 Tax=Streptomyces sp. NPDC058401 TaxID=3346480 RepID=UPI003669A707
MESNGATAPPPPTQPPRQPALPPLPPSAGARGVQLRISRRLLWVGPAAYPLHNIVRVQTAVLTPDRAKAVIRFLVWGTALAVFCFLLAQFTDDGPNYSYGDYGYEDGAGSTAEALYGVGFIGGLALVSLLVYRLSRPDLHVMVVEVASASLALVTMPDASQLDVVVQHVVHAIDHPEAEFSLRMDRVDINLKSYHLGDNVNVYGGVGNTGVVRT